MRYRTTLITLALMISGSLLLFRFYERELSTLWLDLAVHPEIMAILEMSADDQKRMADLDPDGESFYRDHFDRVQKLRNNLTILDHNREELTSHFRYALWSLFILIIGGAVTIHWWSQTRTRRRIDAMRRPLTQLAEGQAAVHVPDQGNDAIGQIGRIVEQTSQLIARQREKLVYLDNLNSWQEAARRSAHEIRTPLTAARLELERLCELQDDLSESQRHQLAQHTDAIVEELDRLRRFTSEFSAFAKVRQPERRQLELVQFISDFTELFAQGWDNLALQYQTTDQQVSVSADPEMIRQVIVNICNNASNAIGQNTGVMEIKLSLETDWIHIDLQDNGPGVDDKIKDRLFEPYATTSAVGKGMGLGLPISRKIMLDHGGDLSFVYSQTGACFRISLPSLREPK